MTKKMSQPRFGRPRGRLALLAALGAAALLLVPAAATAKPFGRGGGHGFGRKHKRGKGGKALGALMHGRLDRIQKRLGLTNAQVAQIKAVRKAHVARVSKLRLTARRVKARMRVEWLEDKPNVFKLRKLHTRLLGVKQKMAKQRFETRLKMTRLLTPAQRLKLRSFRRGPGKRFAGKRRSRRRGKFK